MPIFKEVFSLERASSDNKGYFQLVGVFSSLQQAKEVAQTHNGSAMHWTEKAIETTELMTYSASGACTDGVYSKYRIWSWVIEFEGA